MKYYLFKKKNLWVHDCCLRVWIKNRFGPNKIHHHCVKSAKTEGFKYTIITASIGWEMGKKLTFENIDIKYENSAWTAFATLIIKSN